MCRPAGLVDVASRGSPLYHPFAPQCGQGARTTRRDAALGGDLLLAVEAVRPVLVVLVEVLGSQLQAVDAAGHRGGVVREDRGQTLGPAERMVVGGVVDHAILFVRRVVRLRPLAQQRRRVKVF